MFVLCQFCVNKMFPIEHVDIERRKGYAGSVANHQYKGFLMTKQYFDYETAPEVRADTILAFDNKTKGAIHFSEGMGDFNLGLLEFCRVDAFFRRGNPRKSDYLAVLPSDPENLKDVFTAMSLVSVIHPHTIRFQANNYIKEPKALSAIRGFRFLLESLDGTSPRDFGMLFRLSTNEVMRATADIDPDTGRWDGKVAVKKGWLIPVWSERSIDLYS